MANSFIFLINGLFIFNYKTSKFYVVHWCTFIYYYTDVLFGVPVVSKCYQVVNISKLVSAEHCQRMLITLFYNHREDNN